MNKQIVLVLGIFFAVHGVSQASGDDRAVESGQGKRESFVFVNGVIWEALFTIKYAEVDNFMGVSVDGYKQPICLLTQKAGLALKKVYEEISQKGYTLKVFDCYRPQMAVDHFVRWAKDKDDQKMKAKYYPNEDKTQLIKKGYIATKSGHSRGSTVDLTLAIPVPEERNRKTGVFAFIKSFFTMDDFQYDAKELDMGTPFDYFDSLSHTDSPRVTKKQRANRMLLKQVMEKHGFVNYKKEWWHYTLKDEPYPNTYFNFPVVY